MEGKRIISVCFSDESYRSLISDYLTSLGYELTDCCLESGNLPDLFILDVSYANKIGQKVLTFKNTSEVFLPVIVAIGKTEKADTWLSKGYDDCFQMPFSKAKLRNQLGILLRLRGQSEILTQRGEAKYQSIFESTGTATLMVAEDTTILMANRDCLPVTGFTPEELVGTKWTKYVSPDCLETMLKYHNLRGKNPSKAPTKYEVRLIHKNGDIKHAMLAIGMVPGTKHRVVSMLDITERKRAEKALLENERFLNAVLESIQDGISVLNPDLTIRHVNSVMKKWYAKNLPLEGKYCFDCYHNSSEPCDPCPTLRCIKTGKTEREIVPGLPGSPVKWIELFSYPMIDPDTGNVSSIVEFVRDLTGRRQVETVGELLLEAIEQVGEVVMVTDRKGSIQYVNPAFEQVTGYAKEEVLGQNPRILKSGKQDTVFYQQMWNAISSGKTWRGRMINKRKDGTLYTEETTISSVCDENGSVINYVAIKRDITEHLRLHKENIQLEEQLYQAQKIEAIGKLAGGIAHDFNNMLSVILGYGESILERLHHSDPLRDDLQEIVKAGQQSAALTRQLLAFSRKQALQPKVLDLNELIVNIEKMLRRLIGEDIELVLKLAGDLALVKVDPGQVEQIIMNLAVNARDAMLKGGEYIIETLNVELDEHYVHNHANVVPGKYVMIGVTDTGRGMDKETLPKIFDPFFTTKKKGTGLGLSTVYGIVKQSGGYIWVYSEPGHGTTFKIYLPQVLTESKTKPETSIKYEMPGGGEHILVVEDEDSLRSFFKTILSRLYYKLTVAANGDEAIHMIEKEEIKPDLLITDVIMPGMSGPELADHLKNILPNLKVIFMSGYTDNAITHHKLLDPNTPFLQKPFTTSDLSTKIREVLRSPG